MFDCFRAGNPFSISMVAGYPEMHARGLAHVLTAFTPDHITLMGSVHLNNAGEILHAKQPDGSVTSNALAVEAQKRCYGKILPPDNLMLTHLGELIGLYGALAQQNLSS